MIGLKRGRVALMPHVPEWDIAAQDCVQLLTRLAGAAAVEVQHIGSTAVQGICAKPILDLAIGLRAGADRNALVEVLAKHRIIYRGEVHPGQFLFVMGDFAQDTRSHHIHALPWNSPAWCDYMDFRDFLNADSAAAAEYEKLKIKLARQFPENRMEYTAGKHALICKLLRRARQWRRRTEGRSRLIATPLGMVEAVASHTHLLELHLTPSESPLPPDPENEVLNWVEAWLAGYFAGNHVLPDGLPISPDGTEFQRRVWQLLLTIPYGETRTYGDIARAIDPAMSAQAVGQAAAANPIPVIIPCHRVVASGTMGGYSGGRHIKQKLLEQEVPAGSRKWRK